MTPSFLGTIQSGKLLLDKGPRFRDYLHTLEGKRIELTVERLTHKRTNNQNRWYWGCVLKLISEHTGEDVENLHHALRVHFAPKSVIGSIVVPSSTRVLDTMDFSTYCERVRQWAAEELNINIPDPNEVAF